MSLCSMRCEGFDGSRYGRSRPLNTFPLALLAAAVWWRSSVPTTVLDDLERCWVFRPLIDHLVDKSE